MVTYILIALLAVIFILDYLVFTPEGIKGWGVKDILFGKQGDSFELISKQPNPFAGVLCMKTSGVKKGQLWRLVSSMLLHGGLFHLIGNCAALLSAGAYVERQLGPWKYVLVLLCGAVMANLWTMRVFGNEFGFGASGAIYGAIGVLVAMLLRNPQLIAAFSWPARIYLGLYVLANVGPDKWSLVEHGGAFIAGIGLAFVFVK
ncbi:MAG: rhomboid family intramembrane serine protease [Oscillospiraceae bacterium]|jgi:membrane associated rhomboid family serine protease|nr:rhomboid family intramembrane serine protease [Oscillospiraceae bacterium]